MYENSFEGIETQADEFLQTQKDLELWFQSLVGRSLLSSQRKRVTKLIERCYGFQQAEIGVSHRIPMGNSSSLGHRFFVVPTAQPEMPENTVVSLSTELALDHDAADLVILHHALDFSSDPHQTLREAARVLKPNGNLCLIGFNPISIWGLIKQAKRSRKGIWKNRFLSGNRVADWLSLLDFKVSTVRYYFYAPPLNRSGLISRFEWIESVINSKVPLGAYYVIMARKQQAARISPQKSWRRKAKVIGIPVASRTKPSLRDDSSSI